MIQINIIVKIIEINYNMSYNFRVDNEGHDNNSLIFRENMFGENIQL